MSYFRRAVTSSEYTILSSVGDLYTTHALVRQDERFVQDNICCIRKWATAAMVDALIKLIFQCLTVRLAVRFFPLSDSSSGYDILLDLVDSSQSELHD